MVTVCRHIIVTVAIAQLVLLCFAMLACDPILVQRNDGSGGFARNWNDYKAGFGDRSTPKGAYWLGNEFLHILTKTGRYKLHFDLLSKNGIWYWAEYSKFSVDNEDTQYTVHISEHSGTAGDATIAGDSGGTDGMKFSTYDRDNTKRCAAYVNGGFWYDRCSYIFVNTPVLAKQWRMVWLVSNNPSLNIELAFSRMYLMCF